MKRSKVPSRNHIGERYGNLVIVDIVKREDRKDIYALCKCDCGNQKLIDLGSVLRKGVDNCGCKRSEKMSNARLDDLTGMRFGSLEVVKIKERNGKQTKWLCRCDCGKDTVKTSNYLKTSPCPSCGCVGAERKRKSSFRNFTGEKIGKLTVVGLDREEGGKYYWKCKCDCGNEGIYPSKSLYIRKSCGCTVGSVWANRDTTPLKTHGMTKHPAFHIWSAMMARCYNVKSRSYVHYGGRGITVCKEWHDVKIFCVWADNNGYKKGLSIERKDVNGNYYPENCCWIPREEQAKNKTTTIYVDINGEKKPMSVVAKEKGVGLSTVENRWHSGIRDIEKLFYKGDLRRKEAKNEFSSKSRK